MKKSKKANLDHFAHQLHVTGIGKHKSKKKYTRKNKFKNKYDN